MNQIQIYYPAFALVILTFVVWVAMLLRRAMHMKKHKILPNDMPTRELADEKFGVAQLPNNNLMNLFEIPILFYFSTIVIFQLHMADLMFVVLAWVYVALRYAHSLIHLTYNNVLHRGIPYLLSTFILGLVWLRVIYQCVIG